jgi:hypothetical protein
MFADFNYYQNEFKGTKIKTTDEYQYLGQQASMYIKRYTKDVNETTKSCECALSEYLQSVTQQGNMTSESIPNAYSVSWGANDKATRTKEINSILELYLGNEYSSVGIVKIIN